MKELSPDIINFFQNQEFGIVSTLDSEGYIHCAAKGIVSVEKEGKIYLVDLYKGNTFVNLERDSVVSVTAVDEHAFSGYTLKGKAKTVSQDKIEGHILKKWEDRVVQRISNRVVKSVRAYRKSPYHPESQFPSPQYLIEMRVERVVNLAPIRLIE